MSRRSYGQYCAIAKTLDMVGERWTLLVIRELAAGPKRYTDVLAGVPGMNTTLLAQRLRDLTNDGIVRTRRLPPPSASTVYELTPDGLELVRALVPLVYWGARHALGPRKRGEVFHVWWPLLAVSANVDPLLLDGLDATFQFDVGGSVGHMVVRDGRIDVREGPFDGEPDATVTTDAETFVDVGTGRATPQDMIAAGRMTVTGDPAAMATLAALTGVSAPAR
jgi:DNA-binding HxlR family transcriptional regulator